MPFIVASVKWLVTDLRKDPGTALKDVWNYPIWHLPFLQLVKHAKIFLEIREKTEDLARKVKKVDDYKGALKAGDDKTTTREKINNFLVSLKNKITFTKSEQEPESQSKTMNNLDESVKAAKLEISKVESKFMEVRKVWLCDNTCCKRCLFQVKIVEAMFESGPQLVLQASIALQTGHLTGTQVQAILSSILSIANSAMGFFFSMPAGTRDVRTGSKTDRLVLVLPIALTVLPRVLSWALILAYFDWWSLLLVLVICPLVLLAITCSLAFMKNMDKGCWTFEKYLGHLIALISPCIIQDEDTIYYLETCLSTMLTICAMLPFLFLRSLLFPPGIESDPPFFHCFHPKNWIPDINQTRCWYDLAANDISQDNCTSSWFGSQDQPGFVAVCQPGSLEYLPLLVVFLITLATWVLGTLSSWFIQMHIVNPANRLVFINRLTRGFVTSWDEDNFTTEADQVLKVMQAEADGDKIEELITEENVKNGVKDQLLPFLDRLVKLAQDQNINLLKSPYDFLCTAACTNNRHIIKLAIQYCKTMTDNAKSDPASLLSGYELLDLASNGHEHEAIDLLETYKGFWDLSLNRTSDGNNVVHKVVISGSLKLLHYLNENGLITVKENATTRNQVSILDLNGRKSNLLHLAASRGHLHVLEWVLVSFKGIFDPCLKNSLDCNIVHLAAYSGHFAILTNLKNYLSASQLKTVFMDTANMGGNVFHIAAQSGQVKVIDWILKAFPDWEWDFNMKTDTGMTMVDIAGLMGQLSVLKYLRENVHSIDFFTNQIPGQKYTTVFHTAVSSGRPDILAWLAREFPSEVRDSLKVKNSD